MRPLPNFRNPPINELVLSIQFAALSKLKSAHIGLFWQQIRSKYPLVSEQPPVGSAFETFGGTRAEAQTPVFRLEAFASPPFPRYWFEHSEKPDLFQVQQDRLIRNWRQDSENSRTYPRYEAVRDAFRAEASEFDRWLAEEDLGHVLPNQCEVTYINLIKLPDGTNPHEQLQRISGIWSGHLGPEIEHSIENTNVQMTCVFHHDGKPAGRVYANFQSAFLMQDMSPVMKLEITGRGKPIGDDLMAAFAFMDIARTNVVKTFAALTTPEMHAFWGRTDD